MENNRIKYFKLTCVILIIIWFVRPIVFPFFNLDFSSSEARSLFKLIFSFVFAFSISFLVYTGLKEKDKNVDEGFFKIIIWGFLTFVFATGVNKVSDFCFPQYSEPLYYHINNDGIIKERDFNCGAGDSDPSKELVVIKEFGFFFMIYKPIKKSEITEVNWKKSPKNIN